ncbi:MAG: penicillin-binding protein 2 [Alphaproteobacteria bacterium]|nr:penicillin-binding protein 2 [Alphaproteobacteria bacterium]
MSVFGFFKSSSEKPASPSHRPQSAYPATYPTNAGWNAPRSRMHEQALPALEKARGRLVIVGGFFLLLYLYIVYGLFDTMIFNTEADIKNAAPAPVAAALSRGDIVDRNGELLATSLQMASLAADPALVMNDAELIKKLKTVFPDLNGADLLKDIHSKKRFIWVKRNLSPKQQEAVNALGLPGLSFEPEEKRVYPKGSLTAHIIGYNSVDHTGIAGLEKTFDAFLKKKNQSLTLALDIRLQGILRDAMAEGIKNFNAIGGAAIIMDINNGEILSMVSLPDFDPNDINKSNDNQRFNRASLGIYEMGSTFKTFTLAQALDSGAISIANSFDCTHPISIGRFKINDFHPLRRWLNVPEIFLHSSNIGAVQIIEKVGIKAQREFLGKLGLLTQTAIEIPEVGKPMIPQDWQEISMMTVSYGHGISVNAVQLASAAASVLNGGHVVTPTLLKRDPAVELPKVQVISEHASNLMRQLYRIVVTAGTGKSANVPGYVVGGKTGTADKQAGKGYKKDARLASFLAAFPMNDPKYIVFIMIDEPKGNKESYGFATGGWVAAPTVGRVIAQIAPLLGISPVDDNDYSILEKLRLPVAVKGE